jgi:hypothetical protein
MNEVVRISAVRQGQKERLYSIARRELGVEGGQYMLGDAYNRAIRENPDVTDEAELFAIAKGLALSALSESMRYINNEVVCATSISSD